MWSSRSRRHVLLTIALVAVSFSSTRIRARAPNFVVTLADAGCYGGTAYKTPYLDVLHAWEQDVERGATRQPERP